MHMHIHTVYYPLTVHPSHLTPESSAAHLASCRAHARAAPGPGRERRVGVKTEVLLELRDYTGCSFHAAVNMLRE